MNLQHLSKISYLFDNVELHNFSNDVTIEGTDFCWGSLKGSLALATTKPYFKQAITNPDIICIIAPEVFCETEKVIVTTSQCSDLFHYIHNYYFNVKPLIEHFVSPTAHVHPKAVLCPPVFIGDNATIEAGAYIGINTTIENNVYIAPNCTIGTEGMLTKLINGAKQHINHFGAVLIKEGSYIHANTNISKALHYSGKTVIGKDCHIGISVNIAHDVTVGEKVEISGQTNIAGRSTIGNKVWIGANSTISNWVVVGDNAKVRLGSTVIKNVPPGEDVSGNFAVKHSVHLRNFIEGQSD